MAFARMIYCFISSRKLLSLSALSVSVLLVASDVAAAIVQIVGVVSASPLALLEERARAMRLYTGGIGLQFAFTFVFVIFAVMFHRDMNTASSSAYTTMTSTGWKSARSSWFALLIAVYVSLACVTVSIPRTPVAHTRVLLVRTRQLIDTSPVANESGAHYISIRRILVRLARGQPCRSSRGGLFLGPRGSPDAHSHISIQHCSSRHGLGWRELAHAGILYNMRCICEDKGGTDRACTVV